MNDVSNSSDLERLSGILRRAQGLDRVMIEALDLLLELFACDRAWLLYPCNPDAQSWRVPMERTRDSWPGAMEQGVDFPMDDAIAAIFRDGLLADGPQLYGQGYERSVPEEIAERFTIRTQMTLAISPLVGQPWMLGLHACAAPTVWTDAQVQLFQQMGQQIGQVLATLLAVEEQRQREERLRNILDMTQEGIVVIDPRRRILDANANAALFFGLPRASLNAQDLFALSPPVQPDGRASDVTANALVERALRAELPVFEWLFQSVQGEPYLCEVRLAAIPGADPPLLRASITDISRRREREERLRHSERMESLGRLVGGIAHDFNNILTVILGASELADLKLHENHAATGELRMINNAAQRAGELTRQMLAYARKQVIEPQPVDLNEVVKTSTRMLTQLLGKGPTLALSLTNDLWLVMADPNQVAQILVNLITNARDALPGGGKVDVETFNVVLDEAYCSNDPELRPGRYGVLSVTDNGVGIPEATRRKIFEPFFTTKAQGRGTGLGLATVYGIARQHGGLVTVYSEPGQGTTFKVYLPSTDEELIEPTPSEPSPRSARHTVLVIDDDATVRDIAVQALTLHGYQVYATGSGAEALECLRALNQPIDLALSDVILTDMDGIELVTRLREHQPELKALFMSGYTENIIASKGVLKPRIQFIPKPFTIRALLERVESVLTGGSND